MRLEYGCLWIDTLCNRRMLCMYFNIMHADREPCMYGTSFLAIHLNLRCGCQWIKELWQTYTKSLTALRAHSVEFEIHSWKFKHNIHWLGMEQTPGSVKSGNRCSKPDLRHPTRLSVKVLISRITVYSILTAPFFYERSLHGARVLKIAARSIDWLQHGVFH